MARFFILWVLFLSAFLSNGWAAIDPYDAISWLLPQENHPRVLNTDDLAVMNIQTPFALLSPVGDFNKDRKEEIAISGIYDLLQEGDKKYFLLVAGPAKKAREYQMLHWELSRTPIFIHLPGTTGQGDPNDQAFSTSFCIGCDQGFDFYWDNKMGNFIKKAWSHRLRKETPGPLPEEVSTEDADKALKIAGQNKEVAKFIQEVQNREGQLKVQIWPEKKGKENGRFWVKVIEIQNEKESASEKILVDNKRNRIVKRDTKKN